MFKKKSPSNGEGTPLLAPPASAGNGNGSSKYYFLANQGGGSGRFPDGGEVVEGIPEGAHTEEFAPKQLPPMSSPAQPTRKKPESKGSGENSNLFAKLFGGGRQQPPPPSTSGSKDGTGTLIKMRKAPIKIEPKVFFANERTFLAWMHLSVTLAGASIAILAFSDNDNPFSQLYGVVLLPVAIAFIVYSMYQYGRRTSMIRTRHPGPYEDTTGPAVLGVMLMVSIVAQFALKLYSMTENSTL